MLKKTKTTHMKYSIIVFIGKLFMGLKSNGTYLLAFFIDCKGLIGGLFNFLRKCIKFSKWYYDENGNNLGVKMFVEYEIDNVKYRTI